MDIQSTYIATAWQQQGVDAVLCCYSESTGYLLYNYTVLTRSRLDYYIVIKHIFNRSESEKNIELN